MFSYELHDDEQLIEVYRKHELTLVPKIFEIFVLIFVPWYFGIKYNFVFGSPLHERIFIFWTIVVALFALQVFLVWAVNVYVVTSKRLLHIAHTGLFRKTVVETPLDRILNVSFRTTGLFSTLFRYGDVLVQVVGLDQPLALTSVPNPAEVKDLLWKMHLESGGEQKITYTTPEIAPVEKEIPYAPQHVPAKIIVKKKRNV